NPGGGERHRYPNPVSHPRPETRWLTPLRRGYHRGNPPVCSRLPGAVMLSFLGTNLRLCDGVSRREALRVGGLGFTGLAWADLFRARASAAPAATRTGTFGRAKACIVVFNYGGPSHLDLWDLKPDAPAEIRGDFKQTAT